MFIKKVLPPPPPPPPSWDFDQGTTLNNVRYLLFYLKSSLFFLWADDNDEKKAFTVPLGVNVATCNVHIRHVNTT